MTGFIRGLFGRKKSEGQETGDYYLDADSAKTLGNVEYMRKRSKIRHTFPTGAELVQEISSVDKQIVTEEVSSQQSSGAANSFTPPKPVNSIPTPESTNMDFFRKLAKEIRRR
jgi:hypothetical protein